MKSRLYLASLWVVFLFLANGQLTAQSARRDFNRPQVYDVQHYVLRVDFDRGAKKIIGDTTIRFTPLKRELSTVEFDAVGLKFTSVTLEPAGTALSYKTSGDKVIVTLDKLYEPSEAVTLRFKHSSTPKKGVYFVDEEIENGKTLHSQQIWTQGEPDEARHWFPSFDFPSDKATLEQFITAQSGETVIGNGELVAEIKNQDGTVTFHYQMSVPTPIYLVSFVVGKYVRIAENYRDIPLGYYIYPGSEAIFPKAYGNTKKMMRVFEDLTKIPFAFNKYDQTIVSDFTYGGMENITSTTMADTDIFLANFEFAQPGVEDLVSHELAHSWFGNLVTCKNWAELWLNEGFATFMEAAFREKMYDRRNYMNKIRRDAETFIADDAVNKKRNGLFNQNADNVAALFERPATTYNKGGAVIHTLREEIGDDAFWKAVNIYLTRHRFSSVETTDLLAAMEEASGRDLDWFFDQWVYMAGHPKLDARHTWNAANRTLNVTVSQTQRADKITPGAFRLPLDVEFTVSSGKKVEKMNITKRVETFSYKLPSKPTSVKLDPLDKVPVKTVKITGAGR